mmetsp:Transcript_74192/g.176934  ORF Transcript_74192/g.176934 Transcript_74192/m.176934 type:complete len:776 (-) Transcript_74192:1206-3533(-)
MPTLLGSHVRAKLQDLRLVLGVEQVGHFTRVQKPGDLFHKVFIGNLRVWQKEANLLHLSAATDEQPFQIFMPVVHTIALGDLDLERLLLCHKGCEGGQTLPAAAAHADQQGIAQRSLQHAHHLADMLRRCHEEHKVHASLGHGVVLHEAVVQDLQQLRRILHLLVVVGLGVNEVAPNKWLHLHQRLPLLLEILLQNVVDLRLEPLLVVFGDQAVEEDAVRFVGPAPRQVVGGLHGLLVAPADAQMDLGQVPEVEGVVTLGGRRQHFGRHVLVELDRGLHHCVGGSRHSSGKFPEEPLHDALEDPLQTLLLKGCDENQVEVALVAARQKGPACTRRAHGANEDQVHQVPELGALPIVPTTGVHPLPQQLDGRLRVVLLLGRHVHVVDEQEALLSKGWAIRSLLALVQLAIDDILRLVCRRLRAEGERDDCIPLFVEALQQFLLNDHRLASARQAGEQDVVFAGHQGLQQESAAHGISRGDHDLMSQSFLGDVEAHDLLRPGLPFVGLRKGKVLEDAVLLWEGSLGHRPEGRVIRNEIELILHRHACLDGPNEPVHLLAPRRVGGGAKAPDQSKPKHVLHLDLLLLCRDVLGILLRVQWQLNAQQRQQELQQALDQPILRHGHGRLDLPLAHLPALIHIGFQECLQLVRAFLQPLWSSLQPGLHQHTPANIHLLHEDHAAARHGGRRRKGQVLHLKHHGRHTAQLDDLATVEAKFFVVVKDRVHVLDPDRVHRSVQHDPLPIGGISIGRVANSQGQYAIGPLVRVLVKVSVELALFD